MAGIRWVGSGGWDPMALLVKGSQAASVPIYGRCGAQADAAQALSKLRANRGMVVPLEAYAAVAQIHG